MKYDKQFITDENIRIDENEYTNSVFRNCRIIFTGKGPARFSNCQFEECQWVFDDAAEETIQYLAALYTGLDPGGKDLVEGIFDSIRRGGVGHGSLMPGPSKELLRR
jgi:hypothetical protein